MVSEVQEDELTRVAKKLISHCLSCKECNKCVFYSFLDKENYCSIDRPFNWFFKA